jgi:hypothetical protein
MKSIRIATRPERSSLIAPLPLPTTRRTGTAGTDGYRKMAAGEPTRPEYKPNPSDALRAIRLGPGRFTGLATQPGALLHFVTAGRPKLVIGSESCVLEPGDIFLADADSASRIVLEVEEESRLIQIGVGTDWPGPAAELPDGGTQRIAGGSAPRTRRIYTGDAEKAYYAEFPEMFAAPPNQWSAPTPIVGFRMLRWEDGFMDWHPTVINQLAILSSGRMEFELGGGGGAFETFQAGDVCLAEDRTGEGHRNRVSGVAYATIMVIETEHLWPWTAQPSQK